MWKSTVVKILSGQTKIFIEVQYRIHQRFRICIQFISVLNSRSDIMTYACREMIYKLQAQTAVQLVTEQ